MGYYKQGFKNRLNSKDFHNKVVDKKVFKQYQQKHSKQLLCVLMSKSKGKKLYKGNI